MTETHRPGLGYKGQAFRYVVDETLEDGRVCVRTLGWSNSDKGSLKELDTREGWANARWQAIPEGEREDEIDRPTRWLASDMTPLPEYVPAPASVIKAASPISEIVRQNLEAAAAVQASPGPGPVHKEHPAQDDDADFGPFTSTDELVQEMIEADDEEEDGWSFS